MALVIGTWLWGDKYSDLDVAKLETGFRRHLSSPYRFEVFRPAADDVHLTRINGCFARLRMFDPEWQVRNGIDDRLVCVDLDTVVTGQLDPLFDRPEPFVILQDANTKNPCKFNGSLMMLRAGAHPEIWYDFSFEKAKLVPFHEFPDDQGWLWHKLPNAAGWKCGSASGVYAFMKRGWPAGNYLPRDARMVVFPGWRKPEKFKRLPWVRKHWVAEAA